MAVCEIVGIVIVLRLCVSVCDAITLADIVYCTVFVCEYV